MFTNKLTIGAVFIAVFAVVALAPVVVSHLSVETSTVSAFGSSGGDGGDSGSGGDSGCGGCGGSFGGFDGFGDFGGGDDGFDWPDPEPDPEPVFTECVLTIDRNEIIAGESVTLTWETTGFTTLTLNGDTLSGVNGSVTIQNVQENTTYTLRASNSEGATCTSTVNVTCLPPPVPEYCELEITKVVNKSTAQVGDALEYTITLKNIGDADCTNVRMVDPLDSLFEYSSYTYTSSFDSGNGTYVPANHVFRFTAGTLEPQDQGTVVIVGKVLEPAQCGDFVVKNKAKVTAAEVNNFVFSQEVRTTVDNDCPNPAPECTIDPIFQTVTSGESTSLTWTTTNATAVTLTGFDAVELNGSRDIGPITADTTYTLIATGPGGEVQCPAEVKVTAVPLVPSCDRFDISPSTIVSGETALITWQTTNATRVVINNAIGEVDPDGTREIAPLADTTYTMTVFGTGDQKVTCQDSVTVSEDPVPVCKLFTASPTSLPFGGGDTTLTWEVEGASTVTISPTVGTVGLTGNQSVAVTNNTTFVLTATDTNGDEVTCEAPVTVEPDQEVFSCANNVSFNASDTSIREGEDVTLSWTVTGADSVKLDGSAVLASDSTRVSPSSDKTYTLTVTKGSQTESCPVSVDVSSGGGGGGGSSSPRCELEISDTKITRGEEIEIEWDTTRAREVTLKDDRGNTIFTTDDYLSKDKEDYFDGAITLKPTRDTVYTLIAENGRRDRECEVEVEVEDDVVVLETRTQQPLVTGIALTEVPYTGFEAGPVLTVMFYMLLVAWSLFVTYLIVMRNKVTAPVEVFMTSRPSANAENIDAMKRAESRRPDAFAPLVAASATAAPTNLPTGTPTIGYEAATEHQVTDAVVTELENRAHEQKALLSSDAVRYFISTTEGSVERNEALDAVIADAKQQYPLEDGWIVVNEARMRHLCETCLADATASTEAPFIPATIPEGAGSLAEAIVTGNVVAAYAMIGSRPMFALADAAADLDAVYRARKDEQVQISDMLKAETAALSDEQIKDMIAALTGALDGTYTDEASAVKMAIMKAVKVVG